jgi:hypothetical protein
VLRLSNDPAKVDQVPKLLQIAHQRLLSDPEIRMLADALRRHEPWLEWSRKREKPWFEADPTWLHIHECVSTQALPHFPLRGNGVFVFTMGKVMAE